MELDFGLATNGIVYVRRADLPDETSVYAVKAEDFQKFPTTALALRERRIWNFTEDDVAAITVRQNGREEKYLRKGTNDWTLAGATNTTPQFNVLEIEVGAEELGLLEAQSWVQPADQDRAHYGFSEHTPRITVELKAGNQPQTLTVALGGRSERGLRYGDVRMPDGQGWIFEFSDVVEARLKEYFKLKD